MSPDHDHVMPSPARRAAETVAAIVLVVVGAWLGLWLMLERIYGLATGVLVAWIATGIWLARKAVVVGRQHWQDYKLARNACPACGGQLPPADLPPIQGGRRRLAGVEYCSNACMRDAWRRRVRS